MKVQARRRIAAGVIVGLVAVASVAWVTRPQESVAVGADRSVPLIAEGRDAVESTNDRSRSVAIDVKDPDYIRAHEQMSDAAKGLKDTSCPGEDECESGGRGNHDPHPSPSLKD
jgi:hypothetical protein